MITEHICLDNPTNGFKGDVAPIHVLDAKSEMDAFKV